MSTEICVCVATHRRPQQLDHLLTSLVEQEEAPPFEVVIVDNDAERSAEPVVAKFRKLLTLTYLVEPIRGLARVRNRAVAASTLKYLAFIDDDHCASPRWLSSHYQTATQTNAAVVAGRTDVVFEKSVPDFIRACGLFSKRPYADSESVPWFDATTANCMIRRDTLPHASAPFSPAFDLTGGEDIDLFHRMVVGGALVVAAPRALTISYRPASRANLFWILRRAFRNGGTIVEVTWEPCDWRLKVRRGADAGFQGTKHALKAIWLWRRDEKAAIQRLLRASERFGTVFRLCGLRIQEYRHHH